MKLALFGGTFDPVHFGHLVLAREALEELCLDRVVFVLAGLSPHKLASPPAPKEARLEVLRAALQGEPGFAVDDRELHRSPPSYAIDTIREYAAEFPGAELHYLIGEDNLAELHTWREIGEIRRLARIVVLARGECAGCEFPVIRRHMDISSTEIRNRVAEGRSIRYLLPDSSCEIIRRLGLYRKR